MAKCDRTKLAARIRAARKKLPERDLVPLHRHLLKLAANSAKHGYCQRAGREVSMAERLARKYPRR